MWARPLYLTQDLYSSLDSPRPILCFPRLIQADEEEAAEGEAGGALHLLRAQAASANKTVAEYVDELKKVAASGRGRWGGGGGSWEGEGHRWRRLRLEVSRLRALAS